MSTRWIFVIVLLLILPPQSLSDSVKTTCEIPAVESGDNATLTIHFGQDLTNEEFRDFSVTHFATASQIRLLDCEFSYGNVTCKKTSCCTWESHVTDVFRVYIHNVSQELEGRFWGFVWPADKTEQETCNFTLKATTCLRDSINATNGQVNCSSQPVTIGQTCTVTCSAGHYFQENQSSMTYRCSGKNQWSPDITHTSCEAPTCSIDYVNITNSHITCSAIPVSVGEKCNVTCNNGYLMQDNQTSIEYYCREKNKWSPANSANFCHEQTVNQKTDTVIIITSLVIAAVLITVIILVFLFLKRLRDRKRNKNKKDGDNGQSVPFLDLEREKNEGSTSSDMLLPIRPQRVEVARQEAETYWLDCIRKWYPKLQSQTYFLPPLYFNRVQYSQKAVADYLVEVPQISQDCNVRGDRDQERVLQCLRAVADNSQQTDNPQQRDNSQQTDNTQHTDSFQQKEVMMVISQLQFGKYLGEPSYAAAVALLPRPNTLPEHFKRSKKGALDVLIIHKELGLLTLEIKSVGENFSQLEMTEQAQDDEVMMKVNEAVEQLDKTGAVLKHLTLDLEDIKHITKIPVLPNINSSELLRAINRTPDHGQFLCECLGAKSVADAVKLCLLSDQLSNNQTPSDINPSSLQALREWWQHVVRVSRSGSSLTSSLYEQLVARFCGPATTVEIHCVTEPRLNIRTLGEAVSVTGERMARLVLFPQQVGILNQSPPRAFLSGPPGTGKTIVLIMQGLTWIQRGHDVHVVSTWNASRAVTLVIEYQLQETADKSHVHRRQFDFRIDGQLKTAVEYLKSVSEGKQLCVIADEAVDENNRQSFTQFCDNLIKEVPGVFIWGASVHHGIRPLCLEEIILTAPLRSPPVVVREVMKSSEIKNKAIHDYTVSDAPVPTDGPPVIRIKHHQFNLGHTEVRPLDCVECGHQVARVLKELEVGQTDVPNVPPDDPNVSPPLKYIVPPPLKYRDVLVSCVNYPTEDRVDSNDQVNTTASGLVKGLRNRHVPVHVVEEGDEAAIRVMALGVVDKVTVAHWDDVHGLERKIVVVESGSAETDVSNRLCSISRCTSQLVVIDR